MSQQPPVRRRANQDDTLTALAIATDSYQRRPCGLNLRSGGARTSLGGGQIVARHSRRELGLLALACRQSAGRRHGVEPSGVASCMLGGDARLLDACRSLTPRRTGGIETGPRLKG